jgi:hypothetical protein
MSVRRPGTRRAALLTVAVLLAGAPPVARAQSGPALRAWRPVFELAAGWNGASDLGRVEATTRAASVGTATAPAFRLFTTASELGAAPGAVVAVLLPVSRQWAVAVRGAAARPTLTTRISNDAEGTPSAEATEEIADYTVDLSVLYQLPRLGGRRARPYLVAGGGYLRQLHEDNALVETGRTWHGGGGLRWWLRGGDQTTRAVGLTGEVRWVWRSDGIAFADGARALPAAALGLFVGF